MAVLLFWLAIRREAVSRGSDTARVPAWKTMAAMIVLGTTNGWLANVLTIIAVKRVDSAVVAMSQAAVPLMVAILAHFVFAEEKFGMRQFVGILTGIIGIFLIIGPLAVFGAHGTLIGIGAMLLTAFSYACGTIYGRRMALMNSTVLACGQQAFGALVGGIISLAIEPSTIWSQSFGTWEVLLTLGVMCSAVPTVLYLKLLTRTTSYFAALVAYLQPVWASLLGWSILGERISAAALLGTGFVFVAILISAERRQVRECAT